MFRFPVLLQLLRTPELAYSYTNPEWESVLSQARASGLFFLLDDYLHSRFPEVQLPEKIHVILEAERCIADKQKASVRWEVEKLVSDIQQVGVKPIFLKGVGYILAGLEVAQGRLLSDIDILVPRSEIKNVESALIANGWRSGKIDDYDQSYYRQWMHEIPPMAHIKSNATLDIHHTIIALTAKATPQTSLLFGDAIKTPFDGAYTLCREDMFLHSAAHLFYEGELEMGLRGLVDLDRLMSEFSSLDENFWTKVVRRAELHQLERPLFYALHFCRKILNSAIPDAVFSEIKAKQPAGVMLLWMDFLYVRALMPDHPEADGVFTRFARFALYIRGHYLRMPLRLLLPHLIKKSWMKRQAKQKTRQVAGPVQNQ